jgi:Family of unknown function (DUF6488)
MSPFVNRSTHQETVMKTPICACALSLPLFAAPAALADVGGSCHFHGNKPATEAVVTRCADQRKAALVKAGKLDASWQAVKLDKAERVDGKKGKEWKLSFKNPAATDAAKQTIYLFFSLPGNFIAANYTGQ